MLIASTDPLAFNLLPFVTTIVVFSVVAIALGIFVWPKILKGLDDRNAKILHEIESAEAARAVAAAKQKEFEQKLAEALEQAAQMIREAKSEAVRMGDEIRAKSEADLAWASGPRPPWGRQPPTGTALAAIPSTYSARSSSRTHWDCFTQRLLHCWDSR